MSARTQEKIESNRKIILEMKVELEHQVDIAELALRKEIFKIKMNEERDNKTLRKGDKY